MAECKEAESIIYQEQSPSHPESHPSETLPSNQVLCSEKKVDIKQQHDKVIENFETKVEEDGYRGKPLGPQPHTSPLRLFESDYVPENAVDPSSALHGPPSHDLSYILTKEQCNVSPHHENENAVQGCTVSVSTVLDVALSSLGKVHGSSSPNHVSISKKEDVIQQHQDGCSVDVPDVQTNKAQLPDKSTVKEVATLQNELQSMLRPDSGDVLNGTEDNVCIKIDEGTPLEVLDTQTNTKTTCNSQLIHVEYQSKQMTTSQSAPTKDLKIMNTNRGVVDTTAPFESVKDAVTMFGGIIDWKAHKALTMEKRKHAQHELEKLQHEIPVQRKQVEAAEVSKVKVLKELDDWKRLVEELKLDLERAQTEAAEAKQDAELAQLRVKEMEDGITDDASVATRTVLEVAKGRNEAAASQLKSVKGELEALQKECDSLVCERDVAKRRAEEAISASKEFEKVVEELTLELIATRESLESAHAAHLEAEEHRIGAALARDQDCLHWEKEINQAEEELHMLNLQLLHAKDLKIKLERASAMLIDMKKELAVYMESQLKEKSESVEEVDPNNGLHEAKGLRLALVSKRKELEELRANIDKVKNDVSILKSSESSLKSELDSEKASLASVRQREGMASIAVSSLEAEIERTREEIKQTILKEKEAREKMIPLPKLLQQAAIEADRFKSLAKMAREELRKVEEQAEQAKGSLSTTEIRIQATLKEIEASKASKVLSLATFNALQESEEAAALEESPRGVTLPLEEYYILSKRAHEAEELANEIISSAIVQIDFAKESEMMTLQRLGKAYMELDQRKEALRVAKDKAEKAKEGKLGVEQDLRKWRAEHEQRRRASDGAQNAVNPPSSPTKSLGDSREAKFYSQEAIVVTGPKIYMSVNKTENVVAEVKPRKKKSFFPRFLMFFVRKKKKQPQK